MNGKETPLPNHVQEYFANTETQLGNELFRIDESNSDIKSEVTNEELRFINVLMMNDDFLESKGLKRIFEPYYKRFLRLKVSLDRKGRTEYVDINKRDNSDDTLKKFGSLGATLGGIKK